MNSKNIGEVGERIAIGELSKFGIDIILPMSDNLPFDFLIYYNNKFYKCQVKTNLKNNRDSRGSIFFSLVSTNWYSKKIKVYSKEEVDIFILCDGDNIYLFKYSELENKKSITIRTDSSKNGQSNGITLSKNVVLSKERLEYVLEDTPIAQR